MCKAGENLKCTRKLFLYNLLCMIHYIIFVNSVRENCKSGVDFAPTYENSTKKFFEAIVPKPITQGFLSRKRLYRHMILLQKRVCFS